MAMAAATVWHGSPHKFDKFESSKIGTGEGAQAYGHGLYLSESPDVAGSYMNMGGTLNLPHTIDGKVSQKYHPLDFLGEYKNAGISKEDTIKGLAKEANQPIGQFWKKWQSEEAKENLRLAISEWDRVQPTASLYKVDLPDEHIAKMLDWDKPLSEQPKHIQDIATSLMEKRTADMNGDALNWLVDTNQRNASGMDLTGKSFLYGFKDGEAQLQKAGIPGIRLPRRRLTRRR